MKSFLKRLDYIIISIIFTACSATHSRKENAVVFDKNGNRYTYEIKAFTPNPTLADSFFTFDTNAHPGVEVVDLR